MFKKRGVWSKPRNQQEALQQSGKILLVGAVIVGALIIGLIVGGVIELLILGRGY